MLNKEDVILGQLLASGLGDVALRPSGILGGLDEVSYAISPYSATEYVDQICEVTRNITPHTDILEEASTELARAVRGAFDMVKTYGVPMAIAIADGVSALYSIDSVRRTTRRELSLRYICVDDPFFNLNIYPSQVSNKGLSFNSINFDMLSRLKFDYIGEEDMITWIDSNHPEIVAVLQEKSSTMGDVRWRFNDLDGLKGLFVTSGENLIDFTKLKSVDLPLLMKMFVIVSKMYSTDKPAPWLSEGSLEDYRQFVSLLWNGLHHYLITLKDFIKHYRARELVIVDETPIRYKEITPYEALGIRVNVIEGDALVFYTAAIMNTVTEAGVALGDVVTATLYSRIRGNSEDPVALAKDRLAVKRLMDLYCAEISGVIDGRAREVFCSSAAAAVVKFLEENEAAKAAMIHSLNETGKMTGTIVRERLASAIANLYEIFHTRMSNSADEGLAVVEEGAVEGIVSERRKLCIDVILSTDLIPLFLNLLGCDLAASIIAATYVTQDKAFDSVDERKQLHVATIQTLANLMFEK